MPPKPPNPIDIHVGERIRMWRSERKISRITLGEALGLTQQQIQKYERGFNRVSFSRLVDIAHALDCRVIDLIGDLDDAGLKTPSLGLDIENLREGGSPELLVAYVAAPPALRKAILKLVLEIAKA